MKRCRVAHVIWSRRIGGSEMVAAGVCSNLDPERFEPIVLFVDKSDGPMPEVLKRLSVPYDGFNMTRLSRPLRPWIVARVLNRLQIDVLHIHHTAFYRQVIFGAGFSRVKGVVLTEHSKQAIVQSPKLQNACRSAVRTAAHFTVVSDELKAYFVTHLGMPDSVVKVVKNGVDTRRFRPRTDGVERPSVLPRVHSGFTLIAVGRLHEAKDHVTLLRAVKRLVSQNLDVNLVLVGEGELRDLVEGTVSQLGLRSRVRLLGNSATVEGLLPHADLFVLSSRHEGLPMVLLEAMACGLPVVSTAVGGIPEVVEHGVNGLLVRHEDAEALAGAIQQVLEQPELADKMRTINRDRVLAEHSMARTAHSYAQMYESIMSGRHSPLR